MNETRDAILQAAHTLYLDEGLAGLSMRKIAKAAKISATAIYRHFEDKESMLLELVAQASQIFMSHLSRGLKGRTPHERLVLTGVGYLDFALDHAGYYRIMFMAPKEHLGLMRLSEQTNLEFAPTFTFLVDRVRECMASGDLAEADPEKVSACIWANCHGLCSLRLADHFDMLSEEGFRALFTESVRTQLVGLAT